MRGDLTEPFLPGGAVPIYAAFIFDLRWGQGPGGGERVTIWAGGQ